MPSRFRAEVSIQNIAVDVTRGVRKSLICANLRRQPRGRIGVYTWNSDGPST